MTDPIRISVEGNSSKPTPSHFLRNVLIVAGIVAILGGIIYVTRTVRRFREHKHMVTRCRESGHAKILVLIHSYLDTAATVETIMSALRTAYCPLRLRFAVYQEVANYNNDVFPMAMAYASTEEQRILNTTLRVITMDSVTTKGSIWAYQQLLQRANQGETYTCILAPGVQLGTFWDKLLVDNSGKKQVLTMCPQRKKRLVINSNVSQTSVQRWMQSMSKNMQQTATNTSSIMTYPVFNQFNGWIPTASQRAFSQPPTKPIRSIALSKYLLFGRTQLFQQALGTFDRPLAGYAIDFALSTLFYETGAVFYTVYNNKLASIQRISPAPVCRPSGWDGKKLAKQWNRHPYLEFAGLDLKKHLISGRARLGLTPTFNRQEVEDKFGSWQEYERFKQSFH